MGFCVGGVVYVCGVVVGWCGCCVFVVVCCLFVVFFFFLFFFFFFKQKAAYDIRLSLVGSEMCISGMVPIAALHLGSPNAYLPHLQGWIYL